MLPAPYDWHKASEFMPPIGEIVRIHQLTCWAVWTGQKWLVPDTCGNRLPLAWIPEYWRREYVPTDPNSL